MIQATLGAMDEEARAFGVHSDAEYQSMRARVRNHLQRRFLEAGDAD